MGENKRRYHPGHDLRRDIKRRIKEINWGKHKTCKYPDCAVVDVFSMLFNTAPDLARALNDKTHRTLIAVCEELAVEVVMAVEEWRGHMTVLNLKRRAKA